MFIPALGVPRKLCIRCAHQGQVHTCGSFDRLWMLLSRNRLLRDLLHVLLFHLPLTHQFRAAIAFRVYRCSHPSVATVLLQLTPRELYDSRRISYVSQDGGNTLPSSLRLRRSLKGACTRPSRYTDFVPSLLLPCRAFLDSRRATRPCKRRASRGIRTSRNTISTTMTYRSTSME